MTIVHMICEKCGDIDKYGIYYDTEVLPKRFCPACGGRYKPVKTVNGKPLKMSKEVQDLIDNESKSTQ